MQVIAHPTRYGFWTIRIGNSIYGEYDRYELAVAIMLTR
jgi:hypothetical protein